MTQDEWRKRRDQKKMLEAMEVEALQKALPELAIEVRPWGPSLVNPTPEQAQAADHFRAGFQHGIDAARKLKPEAQAAAS